MVFWFKCSFSHGNHGNYNIMVTGYCQNSIPQGLIMLAHGEEKVFIIDRAYTGSPVHPSNSFVTSGSTNSIGFNAAPGTIKYNPYWDEIWVDGVPWNQHSYEHPVYGRAGRTSLKSGSAGADSYDNQGTRWYCTRWHISRCIRSSG